jgi:hypothetical protein
LALLPTWDASFDGVVIAIPIAIAIGIDTPLPFYDLITDLVGWWRWWRGVIGIVVGLMIYRWRWGCNIIRLRPDEVIYQTAHHNPAHNRPEHPASVTVMPLPCNGLVGIYCREHSHCQED